MNDEFNKKVANFMDIILEQKVKEIQTINNNYNNNVVSMNSVKKNNNINNNFYKSNENITSKDLKKSCEYVNFDENAVSEKKPINLIGVTDESQIRRDINACGYQSKYEQLRESMLNGDDISNDLKVSMSLAGVSKFVTQNKLVQMNANNSNANSNLSNLSNLYITWKEDNFNNNSRISNNKSNNIKNSSTIKNKSINNRTSNNNLSKQNIQGSINNQEEFKIEEIDNKEENNITNNNMVGDSTEDININPHISTIKNNNNTINNTINNISLNNNLENNLNDSYSKTTHEKFPK